MKKFVPIHLLCALLAVFVVVTSRWMSFQFRLVADLLGGITVGWIARVADDCRAGHAKTRMQFVQELMEIWDATLAAAPYVADEHRIATDWLTKTWTVAELAARPKHAPKGDSV